MEYIQRDWFGCVCGTGTISEEDIAGTIFFGNRNKNADFLFADEWDEHMIDGSTGGALKWLCTAFSRDQDEKIYVQHRLGERIWQERVYDAVVKQGGSFWIAGSSNQMPKDVTEAFVEILKVGGGLDQKVAEKLLRVLQKQGRFQTETWS